MPVTDPRAVRFSNERVRVISDRLSQLYYFAKSIEDEWNAENLGTLFPVAGGTVEDGASADGRPVITADDVRLLINRCEDIRRWADGSVGVTVTDDSKAVLNTILKVAVNPLS